MNCRAGLRDCRGQALVEFAMCSVLLLALIFAVVEFGRMMLVYTTIANAARIGARYAIVHGSDNSATTTQIQTAVNGFLKAGTVNTSSATVTVAYPGRPNGTGSNCTDPGCRVTVSVSYPYDPLLTYFSLGSITLRSSSEGVITW
jgi:Flp pilus assembly protein TadG